MTEIQHTGRFFFSEDFTSLTISDIHPEDEGTYELTVTNGADLTGQASIMLDVQCKCVFTALKTSIDVGTQKFHIWKKI